MIWKKLLCLLLAGFALSGLPLGAAAAETSCDTVYCFTSADFSQEEVRGICITGLPEQAPGQLLLGDRVIRPGDVLTHDQLAALTFAPEQTQEDRLLELSYLPILPEGTGREAVMTLSIRGRENSAPAAQDQAAETYKNLPLEGRLTIREPEGEAMTFQLVRKPKRGDIELRPDGTFCYTPKKNKVGVDSFVYTATDASGNISREATVTLTILKAKDDQYTDTQGLSCRFAAEWMKNTGIFVGERLDGNACFRPDQAVTRGEFVAMVVNALDLMEPEEVDFTGYEDTIPQWLRPYVAAAVRSGLTAGLPEQETFGAQEPITWAEAAVMLQNALDLEVTGKEAEDVPAWAQNGMEAMAQLGAEAEAGKELTRAEAAELLYQAAKQIQE